METKRGQKLVTTPAGAAKRMHSYLVEKFCDTGDRFAPQARYCHLWGPKDRKDNGDLMYGARWCVCWEEGWYRWALDLTEHDKLREIGIDPDAVLCEPGYSFTVGFYKA